MSARLKLSKHPLAFRARSLSIPLLVTFARNDGEIVTLEGVVRYRSGDAIVTGVQGEQWAVPHEKFLIIYEPIPPTQMEQDGQYRKHPREVWAMELRAPIEIMLPSNRGLLKGNTGDVLIEYAPGDQSIVARDIFSKTYHRIDNHPR